MTSFRALVLAVAGVAALSITFLNTGASAQDIGAWGVWGNWNDENGRRHRSGRSYRARPRYDDDGYSNSPNRGRVFPALLNGGPRPFIEPAVPEIVALANVEEPGTILIDTKARKLYLTLNADEAFEYPISVGRQGFTWTGTEEISRIAAWPDWHPPAEMRQRDPGLPVKMMGGIRNPLGAVALYLGKTLYRIHGTNDVKTIGQAASSGCFRMLNRHVVHLASLVSVGTTVKVVPRVDEMETLSHADPESSARGG